MKNNDCGDTVALILVVTREGKTGKIRHKILIMAG